MLDFQKLIPQIVALAGEAAPEQDEEKRKLSLAQESFEEAARNSEKLEEILKESGAYTFWPTAKPLEPFGKLKMVEETAEEHSVIACDGSQIMPTQHEIKSCYLLNIGAALIHYGKNSRAFLSSFPQLYHRSEDLYPLIGKRRIHIDESLVSFERSLKELEQARILAETESAENRRILTLIDGSLIPFNMDRAPDRLQKDMLQRFSEELDRFKLLKLPVVGYISHSRSSDLLNILRVWNCPYPESRCELHCGQLDEDSFPCSKIWPLSDRQLLSSKLPLNSRSGFFQSASHWSNELAAQHRICFAYLNCGSETARIEIPQWLFQEKELLDFAFSALIMQIRKGQGYPVSLSEAHNMAVVRQADREAFFRILSEHLVKNKQTGIKLSPKESKKRRGIV